MRLARVQRGWTLATPGNLFHQCAKATLKMSESRREEEEMEEKGREGRQREREIKAGRKRRIVLKKIRDDG